MRKPKQSAPALYPKDYEWSSPQATCSDTYAAGARWIWYTRLDGTEDDIRIKLWVQPGEMHRLSCRYKPWSLTAHSLVEVFAHLDSIGLPLPEGGMLELITSALTITA